MSAKLNVEISGNKVTFEGVLDEMADLSMVARCPESLLNFELAGLRRVNSMGIKKWVMMMLDLGGKEVHFHNCPVAVVEQINLIQSFRGKAKVDSFSIPYVCNSCNIPVIQTIKTQEAIRVDIKRAAENIFFCSRCKNVLKLDDDVDTYFDFLEY